MARSKRKSRAALDPRPPADLARVVGSIALLQTDLEGVLALVFDDLVNLPYGARGYLFDALHNRARVDLIQRLMEGAGLDARQEAALLYALGCFDVCTENRNILLHAHYEEPYEGAHLFFKEGAPGRGGWYFLATTRNLKAVETEMVNLKWYLLSLWKSLSVRNPLPRRPPPPHRLSSLRLPEDHPAWKLPPEASAWLSQLLAQRRAFRPTL